ncbi:MAG: hypothetical protein J6K89_06360 [Oscillospiraceae bacterium]|nr:hypothetical protein [Oscillospiraceae bacterium]
MTEFQQRAIAEIEKQQKKLPEYSTAYAVGEQLKDICRNEPASAELLANDLQVKEMDLTHADKKIYEYGKTLMKGKSGQLGLNAMAVDKVLRDFYKLPDKPSAQQPTVIHESGSGRRPGIVDLNDFFT